MRLTEIEMRLPLNEMGVPPGEMEVLMNQSGGVLESIGIMHETMVG